MDKKAKIRIITSLGTFTSIPLSSEKLEEAKQNIRSALNNFGSLNVQLDNDLELILPKEMLKQSVIIIERE